MNRLFIIVILVCFSSCDYFEKKKVYTKDLLQEELQTFNWKDVDEYPSFESCENTSGKDNKKACFETTLRQILNENLAKHQIIVSEDLNDTIQIKITIDNQGQFFIDDISSSAQTKAEIPKIDSLLRHSFDNLPKIFPAIKRSQQVKTQFVFPVIINID